MLCVPLIETEYPAGRHGVHTLEEFVLRAVEVGVHFAIPVVTSRAGERGGDVELAVASGLRLIGNETGPGKSLAALVGQ